MTPTRDELASLCDENEQLRADLAERDAEIEHAWGLAADRLSAVLKAVAQRDAAHAELGACRDSVKYQDAYTERVDAELAAALAEIERLRELNGCYERLHEQDEVKWDADLAEIGRLGGPHMPDVVAERNALSALLADAVNDCRAWMACAEQLAAAINNGFGADITTPQGKALAEHEQLKGKS